MEISQEDAQRLEEIRSLPMGFAVEAMHWWNNLADNALKRIIVVMAYYEMLTQSSEFAEKALEDWSQHED